MSKGSQEDRGNEEQARRMEKYSDRRDRKAGFVEGNYMELVWEIRVAVNDTGSRQRQMTEHFVRS